MRILLAVVEDLYIFATSTLFGWLRPSTDTRRAPTLLAEPRTDGSTDTATSSVDGTTFTHISDTEEAPAIPVGAPVTERTLPQKNTIVYCARDGEPLCANLDETADTVIATLSYGDMLMVLEAGAEWTYVGAGEKKGFVRTAALAHKAAGVYPEFLIGKENGPREPNTMRVRSVIHDEFSAGLAGQPLQAHEYVYYKLMRRGVDIQWSDIRPRTPGTWVHILSQLANTSITIEPAAGAVMEMTPEEGKPHLAYVEKVLDDGAIFISEADWPDRGVYNERVLVEDEWRALRPTFIVFS